MVSFREFVNTEEYNIDMLRMTKKTRKRKRSIGLYKYLKKRFYVKCNVYQKNELNHNVDHYQPHTYPLSSTFQENHSITLIDSNSLLTQTKSNFPGISNSIYSNSSFITSCLKFSLITQTLSKNAC